jgi:serine/threonine protein kinase
MDLPSDRIGPYRILRPLGSGGTGRVFAAVHEHMGQEVALKVLSQAAAEDPQLLARFPGRAPLTSPRASCSTLLPSFRTLFRRSAAGRRQQIFVARGVGARGQEGHPGDHCRLLGGDSFTSLAMMMRSLR